MDLEKIPCVDCVFLPTPLRGFYQGEVNGWMIRIAFSPGIEIPGYAPASLSQLESKQRTFQLLTAGG